MTQQRNGGLSDEEKAALEELLDANGLSREDVATADQITHLEMFLHQYPKMVCLHLFPNLKTLCLINQSIREIRGLDDCIHLEKLWVVENEVQHIKGLDKLTKLRELYLYSNHITTMENLQHLTNLEVLWLADNYITSITDIHTMPRLRELNLARNDISVIGDALIANTALEVLNLADNAIGSFKEVRPLTRLPHLSELCFADPMWGDCPISALCNYQTYALFMLPKLSSLDTLLLAEETKQLAEATFLKKQMYYNMRIKTLHRNARNIIKLAMEGMKVCMQHKRSLITKLVLQQKELERELGEAQHYQGPGGLTSEMQSGIESKLDLIQQLLDKHRQAIADADSHFEGCTGMTYQVVDMHVGRMLLELETAGNIRLEDGRPSDLWYTSCVDLLMSRFNANDYPVSLGITGIKVLSVMRIHNRWLRNRFEKQLSSCPAQSSDAQDGSQKRAIEYLFVGDHPALPGGLDRMVESGLQPAAVLAAMGLDPAVQLSNNVMLADHLRLQAVLDARMLQATGGTPQVGKSDQPATGRLIIAKAHLGRTVLDTLPLSSDKLTHVRPKLLSKNGALLPGNCLEGPPVERRMYPGAPDAVARCKASDSKQRLWYVFDHQLILPEYLVEFQYELAPTSAKLSPTAPAAGVLAPSNDTVMAILQGLEPELRPLARPLMHWLAFHFQPNLLQQVDAPGVDEAEVLDALAQLPHAASRPKLLTMSPDALTKHVQDASLSGVTYLNLHDCGIRKMEGLSTMKQLKVLVLSFNDLTRIEGVIELGGLQHLDVAHNLIRKVDGLKGLTSLQHLDMSFNQVMKLEEIYGLRKYVSQLTYLDMSGNALCDDKSYRPTMFRKMTCLSMLDGRKVSAQEMNLFCDNAGTLTLAKILEHGTPGQRFGLTAGDASGLVGKGTSPGAVQPAHIQELVLERKHIRRLQSLNGLINLRRASFADNQISHIEGLECCTALEELCMEDNRIGSIEGLQGLTRLKKLQLGKNRLCALDQLACCTNLTQLSVEDNALTSLAGLEPLVCLMELYAGNNRLAELREVQRLRDLPKIIILDLSGNPCTATAVDNYRLYVIYNVRKLKVLDGTPIDAAEQAAAKTKYSGRLTLEFLEEKLGHRMFDRIRDLDVSNIKVRDVGGVFLRDELESLQELNLDGNMLVEVSGLALLRQLVVLKLNSNRLGEECTFNPQRMLDKNADLYKAWSDPTRQRSQAASQPPSAAAGQQPKHTLELFPCLQTLQLGSNQVASISSLQLGGLTSLRTLFLNNNDITRIDGLEGLVNLQELVLDRNRIRYIDPEAFSGLARLRELRLEDNGLRSLSNLHTLVSLQSLHLGYNRISEPAELDRLSVLTTLVEVNLVNNPITRKQGYRSLLICKCPRLYTADGQVISFEEREYADSLIMGQQAAQLLAGDTAAGPGKAIRLTNLDFASLAAAASNFGQTPGMLVMGASSGLGLEGVSYRDFGMQPSGLSGALSGGLNLKGDGGLMIGGPSAVNLNQALMNNLDTIGRDNWGGDKRGVGGGGVGATGVTGRTGRGAADAGSGGGPGGVQGSLRGGPGGSSASPVRKQGLMGRAQAGYRG